MKFLLQQYISNSLFHTIRDKLRNGRNLKDISVNIGWLFFDKILRMGVGLVVGVWVARYLGPEQFGVFNYALAFIALSGAFSTLGLDSILVRNLVKDPIRQNEWMGSALLLRIIGGIFSFLVTIAIIYIVRPTDVLSQQIVAIFSLSFIFQSVDIIDYYFQSQVRSKYVVYSRNISFLIIASLKVYLITNHYSLIAFAWAYTLEIMLSAGLLIVFYLSIRQSVRSWKYTTESLKSLFIDGWPLLLSSIVVMIYMKIDQIMLGEMIGNEAVGNYTSAVKVSEIWYFFPMIITNTLFPSIIRIRQQNPQLYTNRLQNLYSVLTWISVIIALVVTFTSDFIISVLYGEQYASAGNILSIHVWAGIFVFQGVASSQYLMAENFVKVSFYRTAIGAIANIVLNLLLIPLYQEQGAAIATLISYFIATFSIALFKSTRNQLPLLLKSYDPRSLFYSLHSKY